MPATPGQSWTGTEEPDNYTGSPGPDTLNGLGGNDTINGGADADSILGGEGTDVLDGSFGNDTVLGGGGTDFIRDDEGVNLLSGEAGDDEIYSFTNSASVTLLGGEGNDTLHAEARELNVLDGGAGDDSISYWGANAEQAIITGGSGSDTIMSWFWGSADSSAPTIITDFEAGAGGDRLDVERWLSDMTDDYDGSNPFATGYLRLVQHGEDVWFEGDIDGTEGASAFRTFAILENVQTADFVSFNFLPESDPLGSNDWPGTYWQGTEEPDEYVGTPGADTLEGLGGDDVIEGGADSDSILGGEGSDNLDGSFGNDTVLGGEGSDHIRDDEGVNLLSGEAGDDEIYSFTNSASVTLLGGEGNDTLHAEARELNVLDGGAGDDSISYWGANGEQAIITGGSGSDTIMSWFWGSADLSAPTIITDFEAGQGGDRLDVERWLSDMTDDYDGSNPFATGYLRLVQHGEDAWLEGDKDGTEGGSEFRTFAILESVQATDFVSFNFLPGSDPLGSNDWPGSYWQGTEEPDEYVGSPGADTLEGLGGDDVIEGGADSDSILGGEGSDNLDGSFGNDTVLGGEGSDHIRDDEGVNLLSGEAGDDQIYSFTNSASVTLLGGEGNDTLHAEARELNVLDGGAGDDSISYWGANGEQAIITGGTGTDTIMSWFWGSADSSAPTIVTDFDAGQGGDRLDVERWLSDLTSNYDGSNPFATGYLRFLQEGEDAILQGDADGFGQSNGFRTFAILQNVQAADCVAFNFLPGMATPGDDFIEGTPQADTLFGIGGNDTVVGGNGSDILDGGAGKDSMIGGEGTDVYVIDSSSDTISEANKNPAQIDSVSASISYSLEGVGNVENLELTGTATIDGTGDSDANRITGNSAANDIDGGGGKDTLQGAGGDDRYFVESQEVTVVEKTGTGGGVDEIVASVNWTLASNIENLTFTGQSGLDGTGNSADNIITGNNGLNLLSGGSGNDELNGGGGADTMVGGSGNDVYVVNSSGDKITELGSSASEIDTIKTDVTRTLETNVEQLVLTGTNAINGYGNTIGNAITGNGASNIINGGGGADTMAGGSGNDVYVVNNSGDKIVETGGSSGFDTVQTDVTRTLESKVETLVLTGSGAIKGYGNLLDNSIKGNSASNTLNGKSGADTMAGGGGNDLYIVNDSGDKITETHASASEIDTVQTNIDYKLGSNLENLTLTGSASLDGIGNNKSNALAGNKAANLLQGGFGNDTIHGGQGVDTLIGVGNSTHGRREIDFLTGGAGSDVVVLGDDKKFYYNDCDTTTDGSADFAYIDNFELGKDSLILHGGQKEYQFRAAAVGSFTGLGVYAAAGSGEELIAIVDSINSNLISGSKLLAQATFLD